MCFVKYQEIKNFILYMYSTKNKLLNKTKQLLFRNFVDSAKIIEVWV